MLQVTKRAVHAAGVRFGSRLARDGRLLLLTDAGHWLRRCANRSPHVTCNSHADLSPT